MILESSDWSIDVFHFFDLLCSTLIKWPSKGILEGLRNVYKYDVIINPFGLGIHLAGYALACRTHESY